MQLVWRGCALLVVFGFGCGGDSPTTPDAPPPDPDEGARSGTRVKLEWQDYGGTRSLAGQYDSQLNVACSARQWSNGKTYCAPSSAETVKYADMNCTQAIWQVQGDAGCAPLPPTHLLESAARSCGGNVVVPTHLYAAGPKVAPTEVFQKETNGNCTGPQPAPLNTDYYQAGAEVAVTGLAELTRDAADGTGPVARQFLSSADGARIFDAPRDVAAGTDCTLVPAGATTGTCAPSGSVAPTVFHDDACMLGAVEQPTGCPRPSFARQPDPSCPTTSRYFAVGDAVASSMLFQQSGPVCLQSTPSPTSTYYALGAQVTTPQLTRSFDSVPGRTVQLIHFSDGTTSVRDNLLYDSQHATECTARPLAGGSIRCIPDSGAIQTFFSDMGCTQKINVMQIAAGPASCGAAKVPAFALRGVAAPAGTCGASYEIYTVGAQYTGMLFQNTGTCTSFDPTGYQIYQLGTLRPVSEFPLATVVRDP